MGAVILASVYWIFGFLRMGTSGLVAQAHGAGDAAESGAVLMRALMIAAAAGLALIAAAGRAGLGRLPRGPGERRGRGAGAAVLAIRIWGAPATIALYAVTGWLIAVERTRGRCWCCSCGSTG